MDDNFAVQLTDAAKTHESWLSIVRFGLGSLLANQPLLAEVLCREASREAEQFGAGHVAGDHLPAIMRELELKFEKS